MSAEAALRGAIVAALRAEPLLAATLNGVFEGPAVRASEPYADIADIAATDWGTKDARGRELRVAVRLRDAGETAERIGALAAAAETAVEGLPRAPGGWRIASIAFLRSRSAGDGPGRWVAVVEYRVRVLEA